MLEAFAGTLWIVDGRAIRTPPPGWVSATAPRRAPRVREGDTFFVLVTPAAETHAPASFFEGLAGLAANVYFKSGGGVTGGLREALAAIHARLQGQAQHVNALALVLRGGELYTARSGRTFGALVQGDDLALFPANRSDPLVLDFAPLGAGGEPDVQLGRYTVTPGQTMLVADAGLLDASDDDLQAALVADELPALIAALKKLAGEDAAGAVLRFAAPGSVQPEEAPSAAQIVAPPVQAASGPPPSPPPEDKAGAAVTPPAPDTDAVPQDESPAPAPTQDGESAGAAAAVQARTQAVLGTTKNAMTRLKGQAGRFDTSQVGGALRTARQVLRDIARGVLAAILAVMHALSRLLDQILPEPEEGRPGIPPNVAVSMAILIPLVIVVVVVGLALSEQGKSEFENVLEETQRNYDDVLAQSGGTCDDPSLRPQWELVLKLANEAAKFRPNDGTIAQIRADAYTYLDCYDGVVRRELTELRTYGEGADLVGPIVHGAVDLYVLDRANGVVYHDVLNERGNGLVENPNASTPLWTGQVITGVVDGAMNELEVGELIDIAWLQSGGTQHDKVLIALDRSGLLVSYSPMFFALGQQLDTSRWVEPVAITVFRDRLYILDPGANHIWRYVPPAGANAYSNPPEEYFDTNWSPNLANAVDFGITHTGRIFVVYADGHVDKFLQGIPEDYDPDGNDLFRIKKPEGAINSGATLFVDNDADWLYVVDPVDQTIYESSWGGEFSRGYRPARRDDSFQAVSGVYVDKAQRDNMYVIAGNTLYHFYRNAQ